MILPLLLALTAQANVAQTPPMGWNSYDCYGYSVTEDEVRANAGFMAKNLERFGWKYVVIDYVWSSPKLKSLDPPTQNAEFQPRLAMDGYGRLIPDPDRFPSSVGGKGFKPLADWLHAKGLKFGIHLMRGIPRQAVGDKCPILGSPYTAVDAANQKSPCPWLNHMWGLNMTNPAGQAYLDSIFRLYASWGVDFVKVDDLSNPYSTAEVEGYREAIDRCGRPIVLSLSPGPTPLDDAKHVEAHANMWRLLGDLWDDWPQLDAAFDVVAAWNPYRSPGHWPDPDMLPIGRLRVYGPPTGPPNTDSRFTFDEEKTLMTLWCIARCPLMVGGELTMTDGRTRYLLTEGDALWVNQHSFNNRPLASGPHPVWAADTPKPDIEYLALFNREGKAATVSFRLRDIGVEDCLSYDAWEMNMVAKKREHLTLARTIPPHGAVLLEITVLKRAKMVGGKPKAGG
ncbi:MAG TPA: hypothetical protein VMI31_10695 [Fimbriimonadaceae bacterium]|nr:hypothetical protein [Fimbriimonadaceae bacterium]